MRGYWPPPIWVPAERPIKKWLGRWGGVWIGLGGLGFFLFLMLVGGLVLQNGAAVTVGLLVGSVTVASSFVYTMAYRLVPRDTLSLSRLLIAFGLGGLLGVTIGSSFDSLLAKATGESGSTPGVTVLLLAGVSEELAKIIAVVLVSRGLAHKSPRNGLFLGGAVGLGFAALEDLSYAINFYEHPPVQFHLGGLATSFIVVPLRAAETPFLHPLFTALFAAALFRASRNGRFRLTGRVVVAYLGVAALHGAFDGAASLLQLTGIRALVLLVLPIYALVVLIPGLLWIRTARRARWEFQLPVAWWLAPPPLGQPPAAVPFAQAPVHPPLALPTVHPPYAAIEASASTPAPVPLRNWAPPVASQPEAAPRPTWAPPEASSKRADPEQASEPAPESPARVGRHSG